jgi:hypothetical protein
MTGRVQNGVRYTPTHPAATRNPYEDVTYMDTFFGVSQLRPFVGNPSAAPGSVAITDVDACVFYARCGATAGVPNLRTSSTGFFLMSDLNKGTFTPVSPNDVRFVLNGPGAARRFNNPFGNVARNILQSDRIEVVDFSLFKTFKITERINLQYRLELYNALNHPVFGTPATNVDSVIFNNFRRRAAADESSRWACACASDSGHPTVASGWGLPHPLVLPTPLPNPIRPSTKYILTSESLYMFNGRTLK